MSEETKESRHPETALAGKLTAGLSHEFMNVLAVIRERTGLIEDLMAMHPEADFPFRDKLVRTLTSVREQVTRGITLGRRMNQFAHSMDEPFVRTEMGDLLELVAALTERNARSKRIRLATPPVDPPVALETDPFRLLLVLATCVESCMNETAESGTITLACQSAGPGEILLTLSADPGIHREDGIEGYQHLQDEWTDTLRGLNARLEPNLPPAPTGLSLILNSP